MEVPLTKPTTTETEFFLSAWDGDFDRFSTLLHEFEKNINHLRNDREQTVLYCACRMGHTQIVARLLAIPGISISGPQDPNGSSPLHAAGWGDHLEIVAMLLAVGANTKYKNIHGFRPVQESKLRTTHLLYVFHKFGPCALEPYLPTAVTSLLPHHLVTSLNPVFKEKKRKSKNRFHFFSPKKDDVAVVCLPNPVSFANENGNRQVQHIEVSQWFQTITGKKEPEFRDDPEKPFFQKEDGSIIIRNPQTGKTFSAGQLTIMSIGSLRKSIRKIRTIRAKNSERSVPFVIVSRDSSDTAAARYVDVAFQQALPSNCHAVFQVASNFNVVEAKVEAQAPDSRSFCTEYLWDRTQGPSAAISAGAAAIVRVHAPFYNPDTNPNTWHQTKKRQINLLSELDQHFPVRNGYIVWKEGEEYPEFPKRGTKQYTSLLKKANIGYHKDVQVTSGHRTPSYVEALEQEQTIDQVFSAAVNINQGDSGKANAKSTNSTEKCRFILDVSYEGAYLSAITNNRTHLLLTLIGGGAFGNHPEDIYDAILCSHLKYANNNKSRLEQVSLLVFRSEDVSENFLVKLRENNVPFVYQWYKADGTAEIVGKYTGE